MDDNWNPQGREPEKYARFNPAPKPLDPITLAHARRLEDAAPGDDNYEGHDAPLSWHGWVIIVVVLVVVALTAWTGALS